MTGHSGKNWKPLASSALLLAALFFVHGFSSGSPLPLEQPLETYPAQIGGWTARETAYFSEAETRELRLDDYLLRRYEEDSTGESLWIYVGYWSAQRRGSQIHSPKHCLPGAGWEPLETATIRIPLDGGGTIEANHFVVQKGAEQQVVLYWFQSQGTTVARELDAKILLVRNAIFHSRSDGAIIRLTAHVRNGVEETTQRLARFVQAGTPGLSRLLPSRRIEVGS